MDELPEVDMGAGFEFLWNVFKSIYLFVVAVIVAELPFVVIVAILGKMGIEWLSQFDTDVLEKINNKLIMDMVNNVFILFFIMVK